MSAAVSSPLMEEAKLLLLLPDHYTGPHGVDHTEDEGYHGFEEEGGVKQQPGNEADQFLPPHAVEQKNVAHCTFRRR